MSERAAPSPAPAGDVVAPRSAFPLVMVWLSRIVVAGVFLLAGMSKLADLELFAKEIRQYRIIPASMSNAAAIVTPWFEIVAASLLLVGFWRREARALLLIALIAFTMMKAWAYAWGLQIQCGCFGGWLVAIEKSLSGVNGIVFNLALIALLLVECAFSRPGARRADVESPDTRSPSDPARSGPA